MASSSEQFSSFCFSIVVTAAAAEAEAARKASTSYMLPNILFRFLSTGNSSF